MTRRFLPLLAALALLAGACGDDDDDAATADAATDDAADVEPDDESESDDGGTAAGDTVAIQGFSFEPASIEVAAGTTVTWTNEDGTPHTVTSGADSQSDGTFDEAVDSGASAEIDFADPGTYAYFCSIHPSMTGEVVVS